MNPADQFNTLKQILETCLSEAEQETALTILLDTLRRTNRLMLICGTVIGAIVGTALASGVFLLVK